MQSRRAFLGSTAAFGLGSLAAGGTFLLQTGAAGAQGHAGHAAASIDPIVKLFLEEATAVRSAVLRNRARGEHARRMASALKMVVANGRQSGLDARVKTLTRQALARRGREAYLHSAIDVEGMIEELRTHGAARPEDLPDPNLLTVDQRAAGLDEVLTNGVTPLLERQARLFEREAPGLDRFGSAASPRLNLIAATRQLSYDECMAAWQTQIVLVQALAVVVCLNPVLVEICLLLQFDVLAMQAASLYLCSDLS